MTAINRLYWNESLKAAHAMAREAQAAGCDAAITAAQRAITAASAQDDMAFDDALMDYDRIMYPDTV